MWSLYLFAGLTGASAYVGIRLASAQWLSARGRAWLASAALGILLFVIYDIFRDAQGLISGSAAQEYGALLGEAIFGGGLSAALGALFWAERVVTVPRRRMQSPLRPVRSALGLSSGTSSVQLPVVVAAGIGAHGLFEGFAVGTAFETGVLSLAMVLVVGICLHKVGEGACICGCSMASSGRYSSVQLAGLGVLAGAPITLGILTGNLVASTTWISIMSFGAAIGVMAFVGIQLARRALLERQPMVPRLGGVAIGLLVAVATSLLIGLGLG
ncbi:MAG TPA: hypothetical protein VGX00_01980 [Thermoplasmata archaeon]|nr:hypothetical protein [Thermoplasmata archaeon]